MNIILNFISNLTKEQISRFLEQIDFSTFSSDYTFFLAFPYTFLKSNSQKYVTEKIVCGSNVIWDVGEGAFTDSVAVPLLLELRAQFVVLQVAEDNVEQVREQMTRCGKQNIAAFLYFDGASESTPASFAETLGRLSEGVFGQAPLTLTYSPKHSITESTIEKMKTKFKKAKKAAAQALGERKFHFILSYQRFLSIQENISLLDDLQTDGIYLEVRNQDRFDSYLKCLQALKNEKVKRRKPQLSPIMVISKEKEADPSFEPSADEKQQEQKHTSRRKSPSRRNTACTPKKIVTVADISQFSRDET